MKRLCHLFENYVIEKRGLATFDQGDFFYKIKVLESLLHVCSLVSSPCFHLDWVNGQLVTYFQLIDILASCFAKELLKHF